VKNSREILVTDFDGMNVHSPENSHQYITCDTLDKAEFVAELVFQYGFLNAKKITEGLKK
jgi:hypothetical protein